MSGNRLTISLTDDQQKQIREATGKSITELNSVLGSTGELTEKELELAVGGAAYNVPTATTA